MVKFILGKKLGMSQVFKENGTVVPVTVVLAEPLKLLQIKTKETDGYEALQFGAGHKKKVAKPQKGHFKDLGSFAWLKEWRGKAEGQRGDTLDVSAFKAGDKVKVSGLSKGKGFQGAVKRHGFRGSPASHGHHHVLRHVGSIGQRFPQHTLKGLRMAGRMGGEKVSVRGLEVVEVDPENNLLILKGAVPGKRGGWLEIRGRNN